MKLVKTDVTVKCICGGYVGAGIERIVLTHTVPTCKDFDEVVTAEDAGRYLARVRAALESEKKS